jgi:hypothetical protein
LKSSKVNANIDFHDFPLLSLHASYNAIHFKSTSNGNINLEVVGLMGVGNGQSCNIHQCCGAEVKVGDLLWLVKTVVTVGNNSEEAVELVRVINCVGGCTVGFISRCQTGLDKVQNNINKFVVVKEIYWESTHVCKREKSERNVGMCSVILLERNE